MRCSCCQQEVIKNVTLRELFFSRNHLCHLCEEKFCRIEVKTSCRGCGRPNFSGLCNDCRIWEKQLGFVMENRGIFQYDSGFQEWIEAYKFKGDYRIRGAFSQELVNELRNYPDYLICPLPLSPQRFKQRGFNQVQGCLNAANSRYDCLLKRIERSPQSEKSREERLKMEQPFELAVSKNKIRNQKVLLIDDVYTTGRTLFHGAELLYKNDAETVKSLTFAR